MNQKILITSLVVIGFLLLTISPAVINSAAVGTNSPNGQTDSIIQSSGNQLSSASQNQNSGLVLTPMGYFPKSCVHSVGNDAQITGADSVLMANGTSVSFPPCSNPPNLANNIKDPAASSSGRTPCYIGLGCNSGWAEWAGWCYCPTNPPAIGGFTGTLTVPKAPSSNNNQLIYLFYGLLQSSPSTYPLIQPVLQWGYGSPDGVSCGCWAIASWVLLTGSNYVYSTPFVLPTPSNDQIVSTMTGSSCNSSTGSCSWLVKAYDQNGAYSSQISCSSNSKACGVTALYYAVMTLEVYNMWYCSNYPASPAQFLGFNVYNQNGYNITPSSWSTTAYNDCGESIVGVVNGFQFNY